MNKSKAILMTLLASAAFSAVNAQPQRPRMREFTTDTLMVHDP